MGMSKAFVSEEITESASIPHDVKSKSVVTNKVTRKFVMKVKLRNTDPHRGVMKLGVLAGVQSIDYQEGILTVTGDVDFTELVKRVGKIALHAELIYFGPAEEPNKGVVLGKKPAEEHKTGDVLATGLPYETMTRDESTGLPYETKTTEEQILVPDIMNAR
ncbi:uncharacterized protein LOC112502054 [Cynara cardunculus var. scolymus]|nr:uncharacterized protein LOC112502054 [Cynara cardunculus var. scolymus]